MAGAAHFFPSEDGYLAALGAHYRSRFCGWRLVQLIAIVALTAIATSALIAMTDRDPGATLWTAFGGLAGGIGAILVLILIGRFVLPHRGRRLYRQQRTLHQAHELAWDDRGIHRRTPKGHTEYEWSEFHGWREGRGVFLIYSNDHLFHFVPARALAPAAADDLRATLRAHGPAAAR